LSLCEALNLLNKLAIQRLPRVVADVEHWPSQFASSSLLPSATTSSVFFVTMNLFESI
jgi:hypothetical protein